MAKDTKSKVANANVVAPPPAGVIEPGSVEAAAARAGTPEAVKPVAADAPAAAPSVLMVTSRKPPTLDQLNAKHHEVAGNVDQMKSLAIEAAKRAIEAAFAGPKKA